MRLFLILFKVKENYRERRKGFWNNLKIKEHLHKNIHCVFLNVFLIMGIPRLK